MTDSLNGGAIVSYPCPNEVFPYFCTSLNPYADLNMVRYAGNPRWLQGQQAKYCEST
jgi:hypothetical protein